jgi:hypothetical protein
MSAKDGKDREDIEIKKWRFITEDLKNQTEDSDMQKSVPLQQTKNELLPAYDAW